MDKRFYGFFGKTAATGIDTWFFICRDFACTCATAMVFKILIQKSLDIRSVCHPIWNSATVMFLWGNSYCHGNV